MTLFVYSVHYPSSASSVAMSKPAGERALLHVYEPAKSTGPSIPGFGVYHTGIELSDSGVEWCYAGAPEAPGSGVQQQRAKQSPDVSVWKYRETIDLGRSDKSAAQCSALLRDMQAEYAARDYDVIHHNVRHTPLTLHTSHTARMGAGESGIFSRPVPSCCSAARSTVPLLPLLLQCNHFTADVAKRLGLKYPSHINRAATFGSFFLDNPIKDRQRKVAARNALLCSTLHYTVRRCQLISFQHPLLPSLTAVSLCRCCAV